MTSVTEPASEHEIDIHTTAGKLADLRKRAAETVHPVGEAAVEKTHAKGKLTARERILALLDDDSFVELDALARHRSTNFGLADKRPLGDGVVTGYGTIDGREVCIFSQDATVFGGSLGEVYGEKIVKVQELAIKTGRPLIGINDGAGARIQEGVVSLGLYSRIFRNNILASGVIPQISLIMGAAAGGHVYSPALTDFIVMVDQTSQMFITGPDVIKTVTGEDVTMEELGGAHTHMAKSGTAHYVASGEQDAFDYVRELLCYLPSNNYADPPRYPAPVPAGAHRGQPDRRGPRARHADPGLAEPAVRHARGHHPHPRRRRVPRGAGRLRDQHHRRLRPHRGPPGGHRRQSADPVRRLPGHQRLGEGGAVRADLRLLQHPDRHAGGRAGLPAWHRPGVQRHHPARRKAALRLRRGHRREDHRHHPQGLRRRLLRDGIQGHGRDVNVAWPTAQIAVMGASGAVGFVYRQQLGEAAKKGEDVDALRLELQQDYEDTLVNPYIAAERGYVDAVIPPSHTRGYVATALRLLERKITQIPPKKHGNIPL